MVTGEIMPVTKGPGAKLIGATINKNGTLRATATAVGLDTALAQIVKLVQEAQNSPTARRIAAGIFEPWAWCCELRSPRCQCRGRACSSPSTPSPSNGSSCRERSRTPPSNRSPGPDGTEFDPSTVERFRSPGS